MRLSRRRVLISGAASGIGLAVAERFVAEGAAVAMVDHDEQQLRTAAQAVGNASAVGGRVFWQTADVSDEDAVEVAVEHLAGQLGGLDGLVNAAGVDLAGPLETLSVAAWDRLFAVNLRGPFLLCRAALPRLRMSGDATIVNVSSGAGLQPIAGRSGYCASKAGLVMFGKALAMEAAPSVRVNSVCPGAIDTPLLRSAYEESNDPEAALQAIRERYLLSRIGEPREVAEAILYLSSKESSFVTGTTIAVDGGRTFH